MSFWKSLFGGSPRRPPRWSAIVEPERFDRFVDEVVAALQDAELRGGDAAVRSGSIMVTRDGEMREWILYEVADDCNRAAEDKWRSIVRGSLHGRHRPSAELDGDPEEPAELSALRTQIYGPGTVIDLVDAGALIARPIAPGLREVLVFDAGLGELTVSTETAAGWSHSHDELFVIGRANAVAADGAKVQTQMMGPFEVSVSNGFYLGACVLSALESMDAPDGVLLVLLSWHHAISLPVGPQVTGEVMAALRALVAKLDGSIAVQPEERLSTDVLLWRKGRPLFAVTAWPPEL